MERNTENERRHCPACAREVEPFWNFCVKCGTQLKSQIQVEKYTQPGRNETGCRSKGNT